MPTGQKYTPEQLKAFRAYQQDYMRTTYRTYTVRFSREDDSDSIEVLDNMKSVSKYIRELVNADIRKKKAKAAKEAAK